MDIQVLSRKSEGAERRLQVSVSADQVATAKEQAASRVAQRVRLPGFRPGKAPAAVVRKKFAQEIEQEAIETVMREAYQSLIETEKLEPVAQPHAHDVKFADGEALTFELHCEVKPTIELARLSGFRVTRPAAGVTEEAVISQIDQLREQKATWTPVDEKPREGDMVAVQLAMAGDDGTMSDPQEYRLVLGAGQAIPAIEELVMETAPGAATERPVKWPDDFPDETQRGKTKTVRVSLTEVKRKTLPPLDDALARELGDFDSLEAFTTAIREDLTASAEREADAAVRGALIDEIIGANPFDVPATWVRHLVSAYAEAYQVPAESREQFATEFHTMAERQVRRDLIVDTIAERETLAASEADVDAKVTEMAEKRGADVAQVYAALEKAGRLREIERGLTEDRVYAWLQSQNTVEQA